MYTTNNALASSGYNASFSLTPSSPSISSYASSYSGIGGSPNRNSEAAFNSQVVRNGMVSIKEDGFASWLWRPKWLVLKELTLSIHKTEVSTLFIYMGHVRLRFAITGIRGDMVRCTASA
jgi:protein-serine/threonine kinase